MPEIDPKLMEIMLQDAEITGDTEKLNAAIMQAQEMRKAGNANLGDKGFMAGRMYVPPHATQGMGQMMKAGAGAWGGMQNRENQDILSQKRGSNRQALLAQILRGQQTPTSGSGPAVSGFPDMLPQE